MRSSGIRRPSREAIVLVTSDPSAIDGALDIAADELPDRRLVERALEQRREHDLRLRAEHAPVLADPLEEPLEMASGRRASTS
jgi:hypothetical protein